MVLDLVLESGLPEMTQASNLLYQIREGQKYIAVLLELSNYPPFATVKKYKSYSSLVKKYDIFSL